MLAQIYRNLEKIDLNFFVFVVVVIVVVVIVVILFVINVVVIPIIVVLIILIWQEVSILHRSEPEGSQQMQWKYNPPTKNKTKYIP